MSILETLEQGISYHLDDHRIIETFSGETVVKAKKPESERQISDRYYQSLKKNNVNYFNRPKNLGAISDKELIAVGWSNIDAVDDIEAGTSDADLLVAETYELAASAFTEAAFVQAVASDNALDTVDDRLDLIDLADECLQLAISSMPSTQTTLKQRLQIKLDFGRIHRDITCGEITDESVSELIERLNTHLYQTYDNEDAIHSRGLAGEIRVLLHDWENYKNGSGVVVLPASVRGDSGFYFRHDTHDLDTLKQNEHGNWELSTPKEVKRRKILTWMLARYTGSDLIYVHPGSGTQIVQHASTFHPRVARQ